MKKLLIVLSIFISLTTEAQEFHTGTQVLSAGIGFGSNWGFGRGGTQTPALSVSYEQGIWDIDGPGVISLGGYIGHKSYKYKYNSPYYWYNEKLSYTIIGLRSAYHFNMIDADKLDLYAGAMLSFNLAKYKYDYGYHDPSYGYRQDFNRSNTYGNHLGISFYGGARYYFSDNMAVFGELGYGVAYLNIGVAFKLWFKIFHSSYQSPV